MNDTLKMPESVVASFPPYEAKHSFSEVGITQPFGNRTYEKREGPLKQLNKLYLNPDTTRTQEERTSHMLYEDRRLYKYKEASNRMNLLKEITFPKANKGASQIDNYYIKNFVELSKRNQITKKVLFRAIFDKDLKKYSDDELFSKEDLINDIYEKYECYGEFLKRALEKYKFSLTDYNKSLDISLDLDETRVNTLTYDNYNNLRLSDFMDSLQQRYDKFKAKFLSIGTDINDTPACPHCQENAEALKDLMSSILKGNENYALYLPFNHFCEKIVPISFLVQACKEFNKECLSAVKESKKLYRLESLPKISIISLAGDGCEFNSKYISSNLKNYQFFEFALEEKNMFLMSLGQKASAVEVPSTSKEPEPQEYMPENWKDNQYLLFPLFPGEKNIKKLAKKLDEFSKLKGMTFDEQKIAEDFEKLRTVSNNDFVDFFTKHVKILLQDHSPDLVIFHLNISILLQSKEAVRINLKPEGLAQIYREIAQVCNRKIIFVPTMDPIRFQEVQKGGALKIKFEKQIKIEPSFANQLFVTEIFGSFVQAVQLWNVPNKIEKKVTLLDAPDGLLPLWATYFFSKSHLEKSRKTSVVLKPLHYELLFLQYIRRIELVQKNLPKTLNPEKLLPMSARKQLKERVQKTLLNSIILMPKESEKFVKVFLKRGMFDFYYSKETVVHVHYFNIKSEDKALILFMNTKFEDRKNCVFVGLYTFSKSEDSTVLEVFKLPELPGGHLTNFGVTSFESSDNQGVVYNFAVFGGIPQEPHKQAAGLRIYYLKFHQESVRSGDLKVDWKAVPLESEKDSSNDLVEYQRFDCSLIKFKNYLFVFGGNYLYNKSYLHCTEINYIDLKTHQIKRLNKIADSTFYPFKNPLLLSDSSSIYMVGGYLNDMTISNNLAFFDEWPTMKANLLYDKPLFIYEFKLSEHPDEVSLVALTQHQKFPKYKQCEMLNVNWLTADFFSKVSSNMRKLDKPFSFRAVAAFFGRSKNLPWQLLGGPDYMLRKKLTSPPHFYALNSYYIKMDLAKDDIVRKLEYEIINTTAHQDLMGYQTTNIVEFKDSVNLNSIFLEENAACAIVVNSGEASKSNPDKGPLYRTHLNPGKVLTEPPTMSYFCRFEIKTEEVKHKTTQETILPNINSHHSFLDKQGRFFFLHNDLTKDLGGRSAVRNYEIFCYIGDLNDIEPQNLMKGDLAKIINVYYSFNFKELFFEDEESVLKRASLFVNKDYFIICGGYNSKNLDGPAKGIAISMEYLRYCIESRQNLSPKSKHIITLMPKQIFKRPLLVKIYKNLLMINRNIDCFKKDELTLRFDFQIFPLFQANPSSRIEAEEKDARATINSKEPGLSKQQQEWVQYLLNLHKTGDLKIRSQYIRVFKEKSLKLATREAKQEKTVKGHIALEFGASQKTGKIKEKILGFVSFEGKFTDVSFVSLNFSSVKLLKKGYEFNYLIRNQKTYKLEEEEKSEKLLSIAYDKEERKVICRDGDLLVSTTY